MALNLKTLKASFAIKIIKSFQKTSDNPLKSDQKFLFNP
ncbi:hypothetical protein HPPC_07145 [Helicobacter pylori PeCan4]|nr:hypothetical protein HPPC_07145 [Helicobacter pylori PeCan4]